MTMGFLIALMGLLFYGMMVVGPGIYLVGGIDIMDHRIPQTGGAFTTR
jgi:hypothetical protein